MDEPSLWERVTYRFDVWMSRGTIALMGLLGAVTAVFVIVLGLVTWLVLAFIPDDAAPDPDDGPFDFIWGALMRTLDPGTMGGDQGWLFRLLMLVVTIGGLLVVASLIGIVSSAFERRLEMLRKGRSRVLERDHTLILGWNSKIFSIISELAIANASRGRSHVVILADRDKVEMEDDLRASLGGLGRTSVICRTGDPKSLRDLEIASPRTARSIILLAPDGATDPDAEVIKATLALTHSPAHAGAKYHIVGELADTTNLDVARLVGGDEAHWVVGHDLINRITVQTCRQSGLSDVYQELLDFDGDEIYVTEQPSLAGATYFEAQLSFVDSTVIGLVKAGTVTLNPSADAIVAPGDLIIVIAADDSTITVGPRRRVAEDGIAIAKRRTAKPEHTLVLGMSPRLPAILAELDEYVVEGSTVCVVADTPAVDIALSKRLSLSWRRADPTRRAVLAALDLASFDHILVLADTTSFGASQADSRTLVTLLQLRDLARHAGVDLNVVSEVLDDGNRELAEVTEADDFIVSDKLVALALAQISENKRLSAVFGQLFSSVGSEIYLRPAEEYVHLGVAVDMAVLAEAARRRGETAIGYRIAAESRSSAKRYGVRVNPPASTIFTLARGDRVIVLSDE